MPVNSTFTRYEEKYLLTKAQKEAMLDFLADMTSPDEYPEYRVNSVYYDTANYDIIRRSAEKPRSVYREKLRLRCYNDDFHESGGVFLELKKKYDGISYKRRIMVDKSALKGLLGSPPDFSGIAGKGQISEEIMCFLSSLGGATVKSAISYDRTAFLGEGDLRITFDERVIMNNNYELLPRNFTVMEIKVRTDSAMPLGIARYLSKNNILPTGFSKYTAAYLLVKNKGISHEIRNHYKGANNFSLC